MKILDVNVLVYAFRPDVREHGLSRRWLEQFIQTQRPFGVPDLVLVGFVRTVTRRPFQPASAPNDAWRFVEALTELPTCNVLHGSPLHFSAFQKLCKQINATGNLLSDAYVAAFATISDGEVVTCDDDFAQFPGLKWRNPLDSRLRTNPEQHRI